MLVLLKLMGGSIWKFLKNNWIWALPIALFVGAYFYAHKKIDEAYDEGHDVGVIEEKQRWELRVKVENETNRRIEKIIRNQFTTFSVTQEKNAKERMHREDKQTTILKEIINNNPVYQDCKVEKAVVDARNLIRQEGPK